MGYEFETFSLIVELLVSHLWLKKLAGVYNPIAIDYPKLVLSVNIFNYILIWSNINLEIASKFLSV